MFGHADDGARVVIGGAGAIVSAMYNWNFDPPLLELLEQLGRNLPCSDLNKLKANRRLHVRAAP